jgi:periplasmic protein TonB
MTADILRDHNAIAGGFGLRLGRFTGSQGAREDCTNARRVQAFSLAMHVTLATLILAPALADFVERASPSSGVKWVRFEVPAGIRRLTEPVAGATPVAVHGGGSGGAREAKPPGVGALAKFNDIVYTPPSVKINADARLQMDPNLLGPPDLHLRGPDMNNWGNPLSQLLTDSSGPGHGGGIGTKCCGGVGDGGPGAGFGDGEKWGYGDGYPNAGADRYGVPICMFCPQPNFSREAVDAKIQGSVFLRAVISADGRATQVRVLHGLGFGLDESAVTTVKTWRFKPAMGPDRQPAAVAMVIEIAFRLY